MHFKRQHISTHVEKRTTCCKLSTGVNNVVLNCEPCCVAPSEQGCSAMITMLLQHCSTINTEQQRTSFLSILFSPVSTTVNNRCWTLLFVEQHCSAMITVLLRHCSTNNAVTTCAILSCVGQCFPSQFSADNIDLRSLYPWYYAQMRLFHARASFFKGREEQWRIL